MEQSRIDMYRALQSVLTEYQVRLLLLFSVQMVDRMPLAFSNTRLVIKQQMAEHRISNLATNLRKHVVFESSALANEQVLLSKITDHLCLGYII